MSTAGDRWFFDRVARLYDFVMWPADAGPLQAGLDLADREVERVLDLGGGTGRAVAALQADDEVVVDASLPMLRRAHDAGLAAVTGDAGRLPFRHDSVDAVLIVDALHHIPAVDAAIAEVVRVLRPGGVLIVRDFDPGTVPGRAIDLGETLVGMDSTFYGTSDLASRMERAGLRATVPDRGWIYTVAGVATD
ncbi:MAG: class I SAM-dependent methyltransferase [Halobacteriales archaeon]